MVTPPARKPRWASGSRKSSATMRGKAVADQEDAAEPAGAARVAGTPAPRAHHEEQHQTLERRLVELARMARLRPGVREDHRPGQRRSTRPQSSALMKLASRPKNSPIGATAATASADLEERELPRRRAKSQAATSTPTRPPWKDMPPCQTASALQRVRVR